MTKVKSNFTANVHLNETSLDISRKLFAKRRTVWFGMGRLVLTYAEDKRFGWLNLVYTEIMNLWDIKV